MAKHRHVIESKLLSKIFGVPRLSEARERQRQSVATMQKTTSCSPFDVCHNLLSQIRSGILSLMKGTIQRHVFIEKCL